jgi:hypothetical protein
MDPPDRFCVVGRTRSAPSTGTLHLLTSVRLKRRHYPARPASSVLARRPHTKRIFPEFPAIRASLGFGACAPGSGLQFGSRSPSPPEDSQSKGSGNSTPKACRKMTTTTPKAAKRNSVPTPKVTASNTRPAKVSLRTYREASCKAPKSSWCDGAPGRWLCSMFSMRNVALKSALRFRELRPATIGADHRGGAPRWQTPRRRGLRSP